MARMELPFVMAILWILMVQSQASDTCEKTARDLKAELEAVRNENAELHKRLEDAHGYVTTQAILDGFGIVTGSLGVSDLNVSKSGLAVPRLNVSFDDLKVGQIVDVVYAGYDAAKGMLSSVASVVKESHDKHVLPYASEYYDLAKPTVTAVQTAWNDTIAPRLAQAYEAASATVSNLQNKVKIQFEKIVLKSPEAMEGKHGGVLQRLCSRQIIDIFGWKKAFNHGFLDMVLFLTQAIVTLYVCFLILRKFFTIVIGVCFSLQVVRGTTRAIIGLITTTLQLLLWILWVIFAFLSLSTLGVSLMHAIETSANLGTDTRVRALVGVGIGVVLSGFVTSCCCKRRKDPANTKVATKTIEAEKPKATSVEQKPKSENKAQKAMRLALSVADQDIKELKALHGSAFSNLASEAETWITHSHGGMWSAELGRRFKEHLQDHAGKNRDLYEASLVRFKDTFVESQAAKAKVKK